MMHGAGPMAYKSRTVHIELIETELEPAQTALGTTQGLFGWALCCAYWVESYITTCYIYVILRL